MPFVVGIATSSIGLSGTLAAATAPARSPDDQEELNTMRVRSPHAVKLLENGESLARAGVFEAADALFREGEVEYPDGSLFWRRHCEVMVVLGKRAEAIDACSRALENVHSNANVRAFVRALVDGPSAPTVQQLFVAITFTNSERAKAPGQPTPVLAACDIAEKIGDGMMLKHCADVLERMAPNEPETRRALGLLSSRCPPWRFWCGWGAILAAAMLTLGHSLWLRASRLGKRAPAGAVLGVVIVAALSALPRTSLAGPAPAPQPAHAWLSTWRIDDSDPDKSIPGEKERDADPLQFGYWIQDVALKAERASERGDHASAVKFYSTLAKAVPDRAVSFLKMCDEFDAMGDRDNAINACGAALLRDGLTVKDYNRFVGLVVGKPGVLTAKEAAALGPVLAHMKEDPAGRAAANDLACEVGVRTSNVAQLRECTAALAANAPDDPRTLSYRWALAMQEGDFDRAARIVDRARATDLTAESIERFRQTTADGAASRRARRTLAVLAMALLLGAGATGMYARKRSLPQVA